MRHPRTFLISVSLCLFLTFGPEAHAQFEGLQQGAEYGVRVNTITRDFLALANRSIEYDDLAYSVLEGQVTKEYAQRKLQRLSVELRAIYTRLSDQLRSLPGPPTSVADPAIRGRLPNLRAMARNSEEFAESFISQGERLVEAAIAGEPGVFGELEVRGIKVLIGQFEQTMGAINVQLAYEQEGSWVYH